MPARRQGSLRHGINKFGSPHRDQKVENPRATKSGADKTHGVTRRRQAGPVAAWRNRCGAVKTQGRSTRVIRLEKRRANFPISRAKISGTCKTSWIAKRASQRKTHKTQIEAHERSWDMNRKTEKALDTLAIFFARFEQVSKDLGEVDQQFDE